MTKVSEDAIHVLEVVGGMNRAGLETWLMHILRSIDRNRFHIDFLVHTSTPGAYDDEIRSFGSRVITIKHTRRFSEYCRDFKRVVSDHGPYDIVHCHNHYFSGIVMRSAYEAGIAGRITHSHCDIRSAGLRGLFLRTMYAKSMKRWIKRYSTHGLACSRPAAEDLFGTGWERDERWRELFIGIDLLPFTKHIDRDAVRAELGIPSDAWVIGHVGRFENQKNHEFLVKVAAEALRMNPSIHLLLLGQGPLRAEIEKSVSRLGMGNRTTFANVRPDVPRVLLGAVDCFVLPSHYEGLPLVLIEAQAAGLQCVVSDTVTPEADMVKPLINRLSLKTGARTWADKIVGVKSTRATVTPAEALAVVEASPFNIVYSVHKLTDFYREVYQDCYAV